MQPPQTAPTDESNRSSRQAQMPREILIRQRRLLIDEQPDDFAAPRRQPRDGFSNQLLALQLLDQIGRYVRLRRHVQIAEIGRRLLRAIAPLDPPMKREMRRHRDEPASQSR